MFVIIVSGFMIVFCGFIVWSLFNDIYEFIIILGVVNVMGIIVDNIGIVWKSDVFSKFGENVRFENFFNNNEMGGLGLIGGKVLNVS